MGRREDVGPGKMVTRNEVRHTKMGAHTREHGQSRDARMEPTPRGRAEAAHGTVDVTRRAATKEEARKAIPRQNTLPYTFSASLPILPTYEHNTRPGMSGSVSGSEAVVHTHIVAVAGVWARKFT